MSEWVCDLEDDVELDERAEASVNVEVARRVLLDRMQTARKSAALLARALLHAEASKLALDEASQVCIEAMRELARVSSVADTASNGVADSGKPT